MKTEDINWINAYFLGQQTGQANLLREQINYLRRKLYKMEKEGRRKRK